MEHVCEQAQAIGCLQGKWRIFEAHIKDGKAWRGAIVGIVFAIVVQAVSFASMWGSLNTKVEYHERMLNKLDRLTQLLEKNGK